MPQGAQHTHTGLDERVPANAEPDAPATPTGHHPDAPDQGTPDQDAPQNSPQDGRPTRDPAADAVRAAFRKDPEKTLDGLVESLAAQGEHHGLKVRQLSPRILHFAQPLEPGSTTTAEAALAKAYRPALTQIVALMALPDERRQGHPIPYAWCWWWSGDRLAIEGASSALTADTAEIMAPAHEVDYAGRRVAQILRFDGL